MVLVNVVAVLAITSGSFALAGVWAGRDGQLLAYQVVAGVALSLFVAWGRWRKAPIASR